MFLSQYSSEYSPDHGGLRTVFNSGSDRVPDTAAVFCGRHRGDWRKGLIGKGLVSMEEIKNFVDNIHNEAYKTLIPPLNGAESLISCRGGREEESLDGLWNFSVDLYDKCLGPNGFWRTNAEGCVVPLTMLSTTGRPYRFPVSLISQTGVFLL